MVMTSPKLLKNDHSSKNKNWKKLKFSFSFDSARFHVNLNTIEKKNVVGVPPPTKKHPGSENFFLGLVDSSLTGSRSTAYQNRPGRLQCFACIKNKLTD